VITNQTDQLTKITIPQLSTPPELHQLGLQLRSWRPISPNLRQVTRHSSFRYDECGRARRGVQLFHPSSLPEPNAQYGRCISDRHARRSFVRGQLSVAERVRGSWRRIYRQMFRRVLLYAQLRVLCAGPADQHRRDIRLLPTRVLLLRPPVLAARIACAPGSISKLRQTNANACARAGLVRHRQKPKR